MLKKTPLYDKHLSLGATIAPFAGYSMPLLYTSILKEHQAVREKCGLFDVSHMGQIFISGSEAEKLIQQIFPSKTEKLYDGRVQYSPLLNDKGGIEDDILIYRINSQEFCLIVNAANIENDYKRLIDLSSVYNYKAGINNQSEDYAMIALQGPLSLQIIEKKFPEVIKLKYYHFTKTELNSESIFISMTGYTGESGFEIFSSADNISELWDYFINQGAQCAGLGARDTLRLECCFSLYGHELNSEKNPYQCGIGFSMDQNKKDYPGYKALLSQSKEDSIRAFKIDGRGIARTGDVVFSDEEEAGVVTSGAYLPTLGFAGGLLFLNKNISTNSLYVNIRNKKLPVSIIEKPMLLPFNRR